MRAMVINRVSPVLQGTTPLQLVNLPVPEPAAGELRVRVATCGVCHTELDEIEGRTPPPHFPVVPGHEIVGRVDKLGAGAQRYRIGDRVGIGWIHSSSGAADENLDPAFKATGRDVNGGYAEYLTVPEAYTYPIPEIFSDQEAAPLLCAGGVGYRALKLTGIRDGDSLGLTGFGGSAHIVLQLARHLYPHSRLYVFARDPQARRFARDLGADWAGETQERPPDLLHAVIDTTPAWLPVIAALGVLRPGGRLVINAIRKEDGDKRQLLELSYQHHLWLEKEIKTVANVTHTDLAEFLPIAAQIPIRPEVSTYALEQANEALVDLKHRPVRGAKVLQIG
ncbi:MAG: zinc-dependent alcohol dehydrogenase family protein [Chromatiaceae bacterium]|nr:zinc-dependent alcohol dehydrogenase family protein [Gammaproteobacteria bacterium]MCP5306572.1 zinc-dependent alcohol dehydrogenase family protein [Chromatiaceae bacterium]MCP5312124.1 zinc-dependent alcohol dehydrogenase family protein [Chromatiaceae bacterium]